MTGLPSLAPDKTVSLGTRDAAAQAWPTSLGRGVLVVVPSLPLGPLEVLTITVNIHGVDGIAVEVEVVRVESDKAMLRVLKGPLPLPATLLSPATANPFGATTATTTTAHNPFAAKSAPLSANDSGNLPTLMPPPGPPPAPRAPPPPPPPAPKKIEVMPTKTQAIPAIAPISTSTALPPSFTGDAVHFAKASDADAARADLAAVGAVLAVSMAPPPATAVSVRVIVGAGPSSRGSSSRVKVSVFAAAPGTVVVQAAQKDEWRIALDEAMAPPSAPVVEKLPTSEASAEGAALPRTPSQRVATAAVAANITLPKEGTLTNPLTPQGIMALPCHRPITETDLQTPSVPLLLRWLRTTKGIYRVELSADGQPVHTLIVVDGREVRSPVSLATLGKAMAQPSFAYKLTELQRAPNLSQTGRTLHLIVEVLRGLLAPHEPDAIAAAFPYTNDPRLVRATGTVADALGLKGAHARIVKTSLQGDDTVAGVTRSATGARAAWDVLTALLLFDGLSLAEGVSHRER